MDSINNMKRGKIFLFFLTLIFLLESYSYIYPARILNHSKFLNFVGFSDNLKDGKEFSTNSKLINDISKLNQIPNILTASRIIGVPLMMGSYALKKVLL